MTDSPTALPRQDRARRTPLSAPTEDVEPGPWDADGAVLHVRWGGRGAVVVLSGEVDMTSGPRFEAVGRLLREWSQPPVVDASGVSFIDLAGLSALGTLSAGGEPVLVVQPSAGLLRLLRVLAVAGCGPSVRSLDDRERALVLLPDLPRAPRSTA